MNLLGLVSLSKLHHHLFLHNLYPHPVWILMLGNENYLTLSIWLCLLLTFSIGLFVHFLIEAYECFAAKHFHFIWPSETDFSLWRPTKLDAIVFHFPESQGVLWCPHLKSGSLVAYHPFCEDLSINHSLDHKLQCKNYVKFKQV